MLAAAWLARGFDSPELVALAAMTSAEGRTEARRLLPQVIKSLGLRYVTEDTPGHPDPATRLSWIVAWAVGAMQDRFTPYAAAQKVLEAVEDEPSLEERTERLWAMVRDYDASPPGARGDVEQSIVGELWRLRVATAGPGGPAGVG